MHQRAHGNGHAVDLEQVRAFVGACDLMTEIGEHRPFVAPCHVTLERLLRGEQRHGGNGGVVRLVDPRLALRRISEPAAGVLGADAGNRTIGGVCAKFRYRQIGGGYHIGTIRVERLAAHAAFNLRITEVIAKIVIRTQRHRRFHANMHAVLAQAGGLVFGDGGFVAAGFQMTGQVQADGVCLVAGDRIVMLVHGHGRTGERAADDTLVGVQFGLRFQEDWQMSPMHQITAYRVPPMHIVPAETIRVELEEQVVAPLELAQAVRIVHPACERFEMRARTPETVVDLFQRGLCRPIGVAWIHVHVANAVVKQVIAFGKVAEAYNQAACRHGDGGFLRHRNGEMMPAFGDGHGVRRDCDAVAVRNGNDGVPLATAFGEQIELPVAAGFDGDGIGIRHSRPLYTCEMNMENGWKYSKTQCRQETIESRSMMRQRNGVIGPFSERLIESSLRARLSVAALSSIMATS